MKKILSILVCILILATLPVSALASEGDVLFTRDTGDIFSENDLINSSCALGDSLYMMVDGTEDSLLVQRVGETQPIRYGITFEEQAGDNQYVATYLFSDGEKLYVMVQRTDYSSEPYAVTARVYEVTLADTQAALTPVCDVDMEAMRSDGGDYYNYVESYLGVKDGLIMRGYDNYGESVIYFLSLSDGSVAKTELQDVSAMTAYTEDRALLAIYDYDQTDSMSFQIYDPADGSVENLSQIKIEDYSPYTSGLACDTQTGTVYCVVSGEIYPLDLATGTLGESVAALPLDVSSYSTAFVLTGGYYAYASYRGYALRNLNPETRATRKLKIVDGCYLSAVTSAYYEFINANGDTEVILSHDDSEGSLVTNMMNRDSSVDIYVVTASLADFESLYNRGYIADFGDSEVLSDLYNHLNAGLKDKLTVNGAFAVLPVEGYFWQARVNTRALEKLGMTLDDVPTNWNDFMDFLLTLPDKLPEDGSVTLFDPYTSQTYARQALFDQIFDTYQLLLNQDAQSVSADTVTQILQKLEQVDFAALGQPTDEQTYSEDYNPTYDENGYLLQTNMGTELGGVVDSNSQAIAMSLTADTPTYVPFEASVAFINPYSENIEDARAFIETLCGNLDDNILYTLRDDKTEPTPNPYYDKNVAYYEEYVANLQKQLDEAAEADRQALEETLKNAQEELEYVKADTYEIAEDDIAWLQEHAENLVLTGPNWLYSSDDSSEIYDLVQQYAQGLIDAQRLMNAVDSKVRMKILEGA